MASPPPDSPPASVSVNRNDSPATPEHAPTTPPSHKPAPVLAGKTADHHPRKSPPDDYPAPSDGKMLLDTQPECCVH